MKVMSVGQLLASVLLAVILPTESVTTAQRKEWRDTSVEMFNFAWKGYRSKAFPADELRPMTCLPNDNFGGYALTVIDSLDTLIMTDNLEEFEQMVNWVRGNVKVEKLDRKVSVFETNIRILGGLISGHQLALRYLPKTYKGHLLDLAVDTAEALLPAFDTPTGIPFNEVNLKHGVNVKAGHATCPAAAGTLLIEFGMVSALTGDCKYQEVATNAIQNMWRLRSKFNLLGTIMDILNGKWSFAEADIGASHDSIFEYMLKNYILFNDESMLPMWYTAKQAAHRFLQAPGNWFYKHSSEKATVTDQSMNSLQAFWPGLLVLEGDIVSAILIFRSIACLYYKLGMLPEEYKLQSNRFGGPGYPLRPEMVESAWLLHRATGDPFYLKIALDLQEKINKYARTDCGFAAIRDIRTNVLEDKMDSYALSETFKYLATLFDPHPNPHVDLDSGDYVLNTEAHPIKTSFEIQQQYRRCKEAIKRKPTFPYSSQTTTFFSEDFLRFPRSDYVKTVLGPHEISKTCPPVPHYMKIVGLNNWKEGDRCLPGEYTKANQKVQPQTASGGKKPASHPAEVEFAISGDGRPAQQFRIQSATAADENFAISTLKGAVLLHGAQSRDLGINTQPTLFVGVSASRAPSEALSTLMCSLDIAANWINETSAEKGAVAALHATTPFTACRAASLENSALVRLVLERWEGLFTSPPPTELRRQVANRFATIARHSLCASAVRSYLRKSWGDATLSSTLIPLLKELDPKEDSDQNQHPKRWDDIQLWEVKNWPLKRDIYGGHLVGTTDACTGAESIHPIRFLASAATFGKQVKEDLRTGELAGYPVGVKFTLCDLPPPTDVERLKGKIIVVERGGCTFHAKALVASEIEASAMIVVSHKPETPETMSDYPSDKPIDIPLAMISQSDGVKLRRLMNFNRTLFAKIGKSRSPLELLHSSVASAATPYGMVLWRAFRTPPPFIPTFSFSSAALDAAYLNIDFENFSFGESIPQPPVIHTHTGHRCNNKAITKDAVFMKKNTADEVILSAGGVIKAYTCNFKDMCWFYSECDLVLGSRRYTVMVVEEDQLERLQLKPREATSVLVSPIISIDSISTAVNCLSSISNQHGWLLSHLYTNTNVNQNKHNAAWLQVGWQDETIAKHSILTNPNCGKQVDIGSVVRIYKQPVAWMGSVLHLRWFSLRTDIGGPQEQNFLLIMDMLQEHYAAEEGFLGREIIEIPLSPPSNHRYVEVSQWKSSRDARASELNIEVTTTWEAMQGIVADVKVEITAPLHTATHNEAHMPQDPMTDECVQTWDCSVPAADENG